MKGIVDFITTDTYAVEIPPLLEEKIKEDMLKEFADYPGDHDHDDFLYNIWLNYQHIDDTTSKKKQNEIMRKSVLKYAAYYKDKYRVQVKHLQQIKAMRGDENNEA